MNKLIIENRTDRPMEDVIKYALKVIEMGRISGKGDKAQYCYHTSFGFPDELLRTHVSASLNKNSDKLIIWETKE